MDDSNELLDIYNRYIADFAHGLFDVLELAEEQALLQGLDKIKAIELAIDRVEEYHTTVAVNIKDTYVSQSTSIYGISSKNAELIVSSQQSSILTAERLSEYKRTGLHLIYQLPDEIRLSSIGGTIGLIGGVAINIYGIVKELIQGDSTGALAEGVGIFAGSLVSGAVIGSAAIAGLSLSWLGVVGITVTGALVSGGVTNYFGDTPEGRAQLDSWVDDFFDFATSFGNLERQMALAVDNYELNNGELVYPNNTAHLFLMSKIDTEISTASSTIQQIIEGASTGHHQGLEDNLRSLEALFAGADGGIVTDSDEYLNRVINLSILIRDEQKGTFVAISDPEVLASQAQQDDAAGMAARYSLENNLSFIFESNDAGFYESHNNDGLLDVENYSEEYLEDRAYFLSKLVSRNTKNSTVTSVEAELFVDAESSTTFYTTNIFGAGGLTQENLRQYIFDDDSDTSISGGSKDDHLYGMGGNDTIRGEDGSDYLEGGLGDDNLFGGDKGDVLAGSAGNDNLSGGDGVDYLIGGQGADKFYWNTGDGNDVIGDYDDGGDRILINDTDLASLQFNQVSAGSPFYRDSTRPDITLRYDGAFLEISAGSGAGKGTVTTTQYSPVTGVDYGIVLHDFPVDTSPVTDLVVQVLGIHDGVNETEPSAYWRQWSSQNGLDWSIIAIRFNADDVLNYSGGTLHGTYHGAFEGGPVNDYLTGDAAPNALYGLGGDDRIEGGAGDDFLEGGAGSDDVIGGDGHDILFGNVRAGRANAFDSGSASDQFYLAQIASASSDINTLDGGAGNDYLTGGEYTDFLDGGTGLNYLLGGTGRDYINGGDNRDIIYGDSALNWRVVEMTPGVASERLAIAFADGADSVGQYDDVIFAGGGDDTVWGELGNDELHGGAGDDNLAGDRFNDLAFFSTELPGYGTSSPDLSVSLHGDDRIFGGAGNDLLMGNGGNDLLSGGTGSDSLLGGAGNDTYYFQPGDGLDYIEDDEGIHTLFFSGVAVDQLQILIQGDHVLVSTGFGQEGFHFSRDEWANTRISLASPDAVIERSRLDTHYLDTDGNVLITVEGSNITSEPGRDELFTVDTTDPDRPVIQFGEGVDTAEIEAQPGGGARVTIFSGTLNFFVKIVGLQIDSELDFMNMPDGMGLSLIGFQGGINGSNGDDIISGSDGNDDIDARGGRDVLYGLAGDDDLDGGTGDDVLYGGEGDDYLYAGQGHDFDTLEGGPGNDILEGGYGPDAYVFNPGDGQDLLKDPNGYHAFVFGAEVDSSAVALYYTGVTDSHFRLEYTANDAVRSEGVTSSYWIDSITVGGVAIPLVQRSDLVDGTFHDTRWSDIFEGGTGEDTIFVQGWGDDAFRFFEGNGSDVINIDESYNPTRMGEIRFAADVDLSSVSFSSQGVAMVITYGSGNQVTLNKDTLFSQWDNALTRFTLVSEAAPDWVPVIVAEGDGGLTHGSFGTDAIIGGVHADFILPGYGDDIIDAGDNSDRIVLNDSYMYQGTEGIGHKTISGQGGDDTVIAPLHQGLTFIYNLGDGHDTIEYDWSSDYLAPYDFVLDYDQNTAVFDPHGQDKLLFGDGIAFTDLRFVRSDMALDIKLRDGSGAIRIENFFHAFDAQEPADPVDLFSIFGEGSMPDSLLNPYILSILPGSPIAAIEFADGTSFDMATMLASFLEVSDTAIEGTPDDDYLEGTDGNDLLIGMGGDDTLSGGAGRDTLVGSGGNDLIIGGSGRDIMKGEDGDDTFVIEGTKQGKDRMIGGDGFDTIIGGDGDDRIKLTALLASDSIELIDGGLGLNTIAGTRGDNTLDLSVTELLNIASIAGGAGDDTITGSQGDDVIVGGKGGDILRGQGGDDIISGSRGNDTIIGGAGNDTLKGGAGNDTFIFGLGDGRDVLNNNDADPASSDSLWILDVDYDELWLRRKGDHLIVDIVGSDDRVKIKNWYANDGDQLDAFYTEDRVLLRNQVDLLVNAMAAFDVPHGVDAFIPHAVREELDPILTSVWQAP